jgi:hypothetical protein
MYISNFLSAVAAVLGTVGVLMCSLFAHWVFAGNWWGPGLKEEYWREAGCGLPPNTTETTATPTANATAIAGAEAANVTAAVAEPLCTAAYLLWASPVIFGAITVIFATCCFFLAKSLHLSSTQVENFFHAKSLSTLPATAGSGDTGGGAQRLADFEQQAGITVKKMARLHKTMQVCASPSKGFGRLF